MLHRWPHFSIWGAGRDAKLVVRELTHDSRAKIVRVAEVDANKVGTSFMPDGMQGRRVPIVHFSAIKPPALVCVAKGRTGGALERNVRSVGLLEGVDCWYVV